MLKDLSLPVSPEHPYDPFGTTQDMRTTLVLRLGPSAVSILRDGGATIKQCRPLMVIISFTGLKSEIWDRGLIEELDRCCCIAQRVGTVVRFRDIPATILASAHILNHTAVLTDFARRSV